MERKDEKVLERQRDYIVERMTKLWTSYCMPKYMITDDGVVTVDDHWVVDEAKDLYDEWSKMLAIITKDIVDIKNKDMRYAGSIGMMVPKEWF